MTVITGWVKVTKPDVIGIGAGNDVVDFFAIGGSELGGLIESDVSFLVSIAAALR